MNTCIPSEPAIPFLNIGISPTEMHAYFHLKTCSRMLIAVLFLIDKKLKKMSTIAKWINTLWYTHNEYYKEMRINKLAI